MPPRVVTAEEQWQSLEGAIQAWMLAREWPVGSRTAFLRQTRAMRRDQRLRTLTTTLVGLSRGEVAPTVPTPGLDVSLELQADPESTGSDEVPPGVLDLRPDAILAARVANVYDAGHGFYDAGDVPPADAGEVPSAAAEEQAEMPMESPVLEEAAEEEPSLRQTPDEDSDGLVMDQEAPESEAAVNDPAGEQELPGFHEGDVQEAAEPAVERPTDGLIRFVIRPQAKPKMQAQWPTVFGKPSWVTLPRP